MSKKLGLILGTCIGAAVSIAGCLATLKAVKEIKNDLHEVTFVSPSGNNIVVVSRGSSDFTAGLTYIKLKAENEAGKDCEMSFLASRKSNKISANWKDDNHLDFLIGDEGRSQYCAVSFEEEDISMVYSIKKMGKDEEVEETEAPENTEA
jgi:hypothetical protein